MQTIISDKKYLFISIKPEFVLKILEEEKRIELRKVKPNVNVGDNVILYASSPVKSVLAFSIVKQIIDTTPKQMWKLHSKSLGIDKERFDNYYEGKDRAIGIELRNIIQTKPIHLNNLRDFFPHFQPPQIYKYITEIDKFKDIFETEYPMGSIDKTTLRSLPHAQNIL
ncbi:hypothetical protein AGMMS49546_10400 [Spirochaetia bacterium]|nr:hypothetical protein AGMMS49546_10400 [Spirochaetia bacterium]